MRPSPCPDQSVLKDYAAGSLPADLTSSVQEHLADCETCRTRLAHLSPPVDKTVDFTKTGSTKPQQSEEPVSEMLEGFLKLSFLQPSPNPQALGRVGSNDVLGVLGQGAMGVVLKAFDTSLCRHVAIKVLSPALAASPKAHDRFNREARAAAGINHPNVVTIHAVAAQASLPYIVMEYVAGVSLRERIHSGRRFDLAAMLRIGSQIAAGLAAAHAHGVIHRDIKPANIMLEDGIERVKITDFGLALVIMDASKITSVGLVVGTPAYMSPEQIDGATLDPRSDLFSLGCVFYAMATGHSPFQAVHPIEVARRVREHVPPPLHRLDPAVPMFFSDIVAKLLAKRPQDRYPSADEVAKILIPHLADANLGNYGLRAPIPAARAVRVRFRLRWVVAAACVLLAAALVLAGWAWLTGKREPEPNGVLTVGAGGQFRTLQEAVEHAGPGSTIRILNRGPYQGPIVLDGGRGAKDLTIEAPLQAVVENNASEEPVISVTGISGLCLRGIHVRARNRQFAISIRGPCEGLAIDGVTISQPPDSPFAAVVAWPGAAGSQERPIRVSDSEIRCGTIGMAVLGARQSPCSWFVVDQCRFSGAGFLMVLEKAVHDVSVTRTVFVKGAGAIGFDMDTPQTFEGIRIANNTFFEPGIWLNFGKSTLEQGDVRIEQNLVIQAGRVTSDGDLGRVKWFRNNWWEPPAGADLPEIKKVAEVKPVQLLSRDPAAATFLRPAAGTMAVPAGAEPSQLPYIGALPPAEASRP
jgi:hypothetical protein